MTLKDSRPTMLPDEKSIAPTSGPCSSHPQTDITPHLDCDRIDRLRIDVAECTSAALILIDSVGRIVWSNRQLNQLVGYESTDLVGKPFEAIVAKSCATELRALSDWSKELVERGSQGLSLPIQLLRRDGTILCTKVALSLTGTAANPYAVATVVDTTEALRLEHQLNDLHHQMAAVNRLETAQFLAGSILHDFNNILAGIGGHARLAEEADSVEVASNALAMVLHATSRGSELIQRLRGVSDPDHLVAPRVLWQHVTQEALGLLRGAVPKRIRIQWSLEETTPAIGCTESEAHQIVMNLGMNAVAAIASGEGTLTVTLQPVRIDQDDQVRFNGAKVGNYACLSVRDTGCGMDDETRARAFDRFFSTKPTSTSSGLGLSIVRAMVSQYHGFIELKSKVGVGTEFRVYLPCHGA